MTLNPPAEKAPEYDPEASAATTNGRRSIRTIPFSKHTFREITYRLHIHGSFARAISRADIPVFSAAEVQMGGHTAYGVYDAVRYSFAITARCYIT